jgi:hypothetical protein
MAIGEALLGAAKSAGGGALQGLKDMVGANQKAVLEIADFSKTKISVENAKKPSAGNASINKALGSGFNLEAMSSYASNLGKLGEGAGGSFKDYKGFKKYRFECQFNPEEISINGYGGEELPIQNYAKANEEGQKGQRSRGNDDNPSSPPDKKGSHMDSAKTHIDMSFRLVFDKTNIQDAFYADKYTLSATNIGKGIGTAVQKAKGKSYSVQPEVEALTAIVRDNNKRLARFAWGDMAYEGVINSVSAEYVMFNTNGEPCRAFVNISMILYDEAVAGANTKFWKDKYMKDIYSIKYGGVIPEELPEAKGDYSEALTSMFG